MAELVHAIVIMAFFHALSGFSLGCGINPELDTLLGFSLSTKPDIPTCTNPALGIGAAPSSDSEHTDSEQSPTNSPPNPSLSQYLVQHYIESEDCSNACSFSLSFDCPSSPRFLATQGQSRQRLTDFILQTMPDSDEEEEEEEEEPRLKDEEFARSLSSFGCEFCTAGVGVV